VNTFWKGLNPIGQRVRPCCGDQVPWRTVIGVAKDVKQGGVDQKTGTELYFFVDQTARHAPPPNNVPVTMHVVVRTGLTESAMAPAIERIVREAAPAVPVARFREMEDVFAETIQRPWLLAQLTAGFAGLALLLAAIGTYGVLSFMVAERRREIGIRLALGQDRFSVLAHVMRQGLVLTAIGILTGVAAALALNRLIVSLLFGVRPTDPATLVAVVAAIATVAAGACWLPAWRASRLDPNVVLREELVGNPKSQIPKPKSQGSKPGPELVFRGALDSLDDDHLDRCAYRFQPESQLLFQRGRQPRAFRNPALALGEAGDIVRQPVEVEVEVAGEPGAIEHRQSGSAIPRDALRELGDRDSACVDGTRAAPATAQGSRSLRRGRSTPAAPPRDHRFTVRLRPLKPGARSAVAACKDEGESRHLPGFSAHDELQALGKQRLQHQHPTGYRRLRLGAAGEIVSLSVNPLRTADDPVESRQIVRAPNELADAHVVEGDQAARAQLAG
jgi:hypothetical protein